MRFLFLLICCFILNVVAFAQEDASVDPALQEQEVIKIIQQMFDGMRAGDSSMVSAVFAPEMTMKSFFTNKEGKAVLRKGNAQGFLDAVGTPHDKVWDEKIWSYEVKIEDRLAIAWTDYTFYLGGEMSHCGVNTFTLFNSDAGWVITDITDTRKREGCQTISADQQKINSLMDAWHKAAATADEDVFFGSMAENAIYLGTDDSERWLRDDMKEWSKEYFDRDSAWDFTPSAREIYFSEDGQTAWFEEKLATWMGPCRGSGVVSMINGEWKLRHYNLAVTVPNDKIKSFIELMGKE